jgi:hypothetical protein
MTGKGNSGLEGARRGGKPQGETAPDPPTMPTVPISPTVKTPRRPLPAAERGGALEPRWKISPLTAVLSLLAALVAGIAIASFLVSRANRSAPAAEPFPQSTPIPSASDPGFAGTGGITAGSRPETPVPDAPTITETDTDTEARVDEYREQDKRDRDKREDEREREDDKREAKREREENKRDRKRDKEGDRDDRDRSDR